MSSAIIKARHLFQGEYLLWYDGRGFGSPIPVPLAMDFHPFVLLSYFVPLRIVYSVLWIFHIFIGSYFYFRICKLLDLNELFSRLSTFLFVFSLPTIQYVIIDDWMGTVLHWPMYPVITYFIIKIILSQGIKKLKYFLFCTLTLGFMMLNGVAGSLGLTFFIVLAIFGLIILLYNFEFKSIYLLTFLVIFSGIIASPRIFHTISEISRFPDDLVRVAQETFSLRDYFKSNLDPLSSNIIKNIISFNFSEAIEYLKIDLKTLGTRKPFIGLVYLICGLASLLFIKKRYSYLLSSKLNGLAQACALSFLISIVFSISPSSYTFDMCHPWLFRDPMIFFGILSSGVFLQTLFNSKSQVKRKIAKIFVAIHLVQISLYTFNLVFFTSGSGHFNKWSGKDINFFRPPDRNNDLNNWLKMCGQKYGKRILLSPDIEGNLIEEIPVLGSNNFYAVQDLNLYSELEPLNGYYNISMDEFFPSPNKPKGYISVNYDLINNNSLLDVAGISCVLMRSDEIGKLNSSSDLKIKERISFENSSAIYDDLEPWGESSHINEEWVLLHNEDVWGKYFGLSTDIYDLKLKYRDSCQHCTTRNFVEFYNEKTVKRFLCADLDSLYKYRLNKDIKVDGGNGNYSIKIENNNEKFILGMSTLYRKSWKAETKNGNELKVLPLFGAFIGVEIPEGELEFDLTYHPKTRITLLLFSLFTVVSLSVMLFVLSFKPHLVSRYI
tara:strand:- start:834 stop:2996 length:2163 start_codon:yes stop_codon:yes gene_type:complete